MKNIFHRKLPPGWKCIRNYIWKAIKLTHLASDSPLDTCALCCRWDEIAHAASQLATQWPPPAATGRVCKALITAVGQCGARDEWLSLTLMMRNAHSITASLSSDLVHAEDALDDGTSTVQHMYSLPVPVPGGPPVPVPVPVPVPAPVPVPVQL